MSLELSCRQADYVTEGSCARVVDVDPCASGPCENGGTCTREDDGYRCDCPVCGCSQGGATSTCALGTCHLLPET